MKIWLVFLLFSKETCSEASSFRSTQFVSGEFGDSGHGKKKIMFTRLENDRLTLQNAAFFEHLLAFSGRKLQGLTSANMEKQALQNALQRLQTSLNVGEVLTDASTSIKKLRGKNSNITVLCFVCNSKTNNDSFK